MKHFLDMLSIDVLQSFDRLKSSCLINHMQNEAIFNIHDVDDDWIVEVDVILIF